jgi:hypothetical protein
MRRSACFILFVALAICVLPSNAQSGASTIEAHFTGKEVVLKMFAVVSPTNKSESSSTAIANS